MAYVYRHIRKDKNEPFYIGIGNDSTYKMAKELSLQATKISACLNGRRKQTGGYKFIRE